MSNLTNDEASAVLVLMGICSSIGWLIGFLCGRLHEIGKRSAKEQQ